MKKINGIRLYASLGGILFMSACHKDAVEPVVIKKSRNGEFKATVSVDSAAAFTFLAKGDNTLFTTRTGLSGEKVITILGDYKNTTLEFTLVNMIATGTYPLSMNDPIQYSWCDYTKKGGGILNYPSHSTRILNGSGTVTLDSLTATYISGTFQATLAGNSGGVVKVTSGSFKGLFLEN